MKTVHTTEIFDGWFAGLADEQGSFVFKPGLTVRKWATLAIASL
jgi:hypothetical protein